MADGPNNDRKPGDLRSQVWFSRQDKMGFYYRSWLRNRGPVSSSPPL